MNLNKNGLIVRKENIISRFINKIKIFLFRKNKAQIEEYKKLVNEEIELQNLLNIKQEELEKIKIKRLNITLAIYEQEEQYLKQLLKMKKEELSTLSKEKV